MGNPYTPVYVDPGAALVSQIRGHDRISSENDHRAIYLDMMGFHGAAREARAGAEYHDDMSRIKRGALDKLNADRAKEAAE